MSTKDIERLKRKIKGKNWAEDVPDFMIMPDGIVVDVVKKREPDQRLIEYGKRLRVARKEKGLTLEELSQGIGVTSSTLSRIEKGQVATREVTRRALAQALNVSDAWLETGDGQKERADSDELIRIMETLIAEGETGARYRIARAVVHMTDEQVGALVSLCESVAENGKNEG